MSDIDLDHPVFRSRFPDGKVPIVNTRGFVALWRYGLDWLEDLDVNRLDQVREMYVVMASEDAPGGNKAIAAVNAWKKEKRELLVELHEVLSFQQISAYTNVPLNEVLDDYQGVRQTKTHEQLLREEQDGTPECTTNHHHDARSRATTSVR